MRTTWTGKDWKPSQWDCSCEDLVDTPSALSAKCTVQWICENRTCQMLFLKVVEPAQASWATTILPAPRKEKLPRFRVYLQFLKSVRNQDAYPSLCMDNYTDSLRKAVSYSNLEDDNGYCQVSIEETDDDTKDIYIPSRTVSNRTDTIRSEVCPEIILSCEGRYNVSKKEAVFSSIPRRRFCNFVLTMRSLQ